jgi:hypothetical protein
MNASTVAFEAALLAGRLRLVLPAPADALAPPDVIDAALLLAEHEALMKSLEPWLQAGIVPALVASDAPNTLVWATTDSGVQLGFDWPLLASIDPTAPPPPALQWQAMVFSVEVARLDRAPWPNSPESSTSPASAQTKSPGVLLLPPSFAPSWRVQLHGPLLTTEAEWDGPGSPLMLSGAPALREPNAAEPTWAVHIDTPCTFTPPQLLGWDAALPAPMPADASLHGPQGQRWPGRIAPALGGAGLWF